MARHAVLFAGPSLAAEDLDGHPGIERRPPAARGDVLTALADRPRAIGLVDGYFGDRRSVLHKEILEAMAEGVPVLGAASMGALRAAELDAYGMVGIGHIYRDYATGVRVSDADVAVAHGPAELGFPSLSVALVDVVATTRALVARGRLTRLEAGAIDAAAGPLHYAERTWPRIAEAAGQGDAARSRLSRLLADAHVEAKRLDAIALVAALARTGPGAPPRPDIWPPLTPAYRRARRDSGLG